MAAELYPASANTNIPNSNGTTVTAPSKKSVVQVCQAVTASATHATQQNISNNNVEAASWQCSHPTLRERNALMFNNELMADVHFIVGPTGASQRVPAHKYVLAVGSSVFCAMFYGDLAEGKSEIHIPDVEPAAFLILLKYMYSDEIDLEADTVLATLYAAKKYIVPALAKACVNFLETSLEAKNACVLLSQSRLFEEPELTQRCWEVIDAQAELALKSEGFCEIDQQTLEIILTRETLNTKEAVVFEAVLSWAVAECKRQGLGVTTRNKRGVLGKALYLVRIPTMTLEEFANGAAQSDILTLEETHSIFLWYTASNKPKLEFPLTKRKGLAPQRCHRFQSSAYRSNQWRYRGRCDSIQFAVDKRIFIAGLGLYGSSGGKAEYSVKIELKRQGATLAQNLTKFVSDGSSSTFPVWFEHPVQVEHDTFYTVSAILDGNELSYFGQEGMTEVQCGKVTFQFQCSSDSTNGTGVQGGQIPELVFYA
ncbi:BTB/POZ domain-containing protein 6-B isoform X3 [Lepisosteus oculatus]|nr:PREDICTED: BTB/POZ domain-containing protein 6 isoform X3 [Lepisosteus oculatus]XP_015205799.1 PREDICTED: BTB/POZ domain-containing protein 6 isoform X3 [Lepisosteus oculatus]XP_015205800.1 PREDICTED: BTB/POZ domain-containing protein 6 isoform X3 [Lepisosteus oculatus]